MVAQTGINPVSNLLLKVLEFQKIVKKCLISS